MNKFVNKILKEADTDDPFFQPKDIQKKGEKIKKQRERILRKIKSGLQNIKTAYENKSSETKEEELFLQIFSKFHLNEFYESGYKVWSLENDNNKRRCVFNLKYYECWISYYNIWTIFEEKFHLGYNEIASFIEDMLKKYFKLNEFTHEWHVTIAYY